MSIFRTSLLISGHEVFQVLIVGIVIGILLAINIHLVEFIKAREVLNGAMNIGITSTKILETLTRKLGLRLINNLLTLAWCCLSSLTRSCVAIRSALVDTL